MSLAPPTVVLNTSQQYFVDQMRTYFTAWGLPVSGSTQTLPSPRPGDAELWQDFYFGLSYFNTCPPIMTFYNINDLYAAAQRSINSGGDPNAPTTFGVVDVLVAPVILCAVFFTGLRLQWFEAGKHFMYNDNGIYIERKKQADYQNIVGGNVLQFVIGGQLKQLRQILGFWRINPKGQFSGMISYPRSLTRGIRGTRLGF